MCPNVPKLSSNVNECEPLLHGCHDVRRDQLGVVQLIHAVAHELHGGVRQRRGGQGLTLVPISAQLELTLPLSAQLKPTLSPTQLKFNPWMWPEGAQVQLQRERCVPEVLKLSFEVSECEPLVAGYAHIQMLRGEDWYVTGPNGSSHSGLRYLAGRRRLTLSNPR
jgi:hypothetical protein